MRARATVLFLSVLLGGAAVAGVSPALALPPCIAMDPADASLDLACPPAVRPGAKSNVCTLGFVATDGVELYVAAAGHCALLGKRVTVQGVPGEVGTVMLRRNEFFPGTGTRDWAFVRIDPEDRARVDPTMARWGGPHAGLLGAARTPQPGEPVLHYGQGMGLGADERTRGRAGLTLPNVWGPDAFTFLGSIAGGDSGSPVRAETGEAAGLVVGTTEEGLVVAMRFDHAVADLAASIGRPAWVVEGAPIVETP